MTDLGKWKCNIDGETQGVINGVCPTHGPCQTTPVDETAKKLAGYYEAEEEKKKNAETTNTPEK